MDLQTVINLGAGTALAVVGWLARELWGAVKELRHDLASIRVEIAQHYTSKDDFKESIREVKELLLAIDAKLDRKADKP